jgi:hypothetical protein
MSDDRLIAVNAAVSAAGVSRHFIIDLDSAKKIAKHAYPEYKGRKIKLVVGQESIDTTQDVNWSGGTRTEYIFVRLDNGDIMKNPNQHLPPWKQDSSHAMAKLSDGLVCVTHTIFLGKDCGLTVWTDQPKD